MSDYQSARFTLFHVFTFCCWGVLSRNSSQISDYAECGSFLTGSTVDKANVYGGGSGDVLYLFHIDAELTVVFDGCKSSYDTYFYVFDASLTDVVCKCDDCGDCGLATILKCTLIGPADYIFMIGGYMREEGDYEVDIYCQEVTPEDLVCLYATELEDVESRLLTEGCDADNREETCDVNGFLASDVWYYSAGYQIPETPPEEFCCGTDAPGWLNNTHPTESDGIVTREVCYNWDGEQCHWDNEIQVVKCSAFYAYQLRDPPECYLRYCFETVEGCFAHSDCDFSEYCDRHHDCWACDQCDTYGDAIDSTCPDCPPDECNSRDDCGPDLYCDTNFDCWPCEECDIYHDAIEGYCPTCFIEECEQGGESGSEWIVCDYGDTSAWVSHATGNRGIYNAVEICAQLGFLSVTTWGAGCNAECGSCDGPTTCFAPGRRRFDGVGGIIPTTLSGNVMWECGNPVTEQVTATPLQTLVPTIRPTKTPKSPNIPTQSSTFDPTSEPALTYIEEEEEELEYNIFIIGALQSYDEAKGSCHAVKSHLATIHSEDQNQEVQSLGVDVWIGLSDSNKQGSFHWIDFSDLDYENWLPEEDPTNTTKQEKYSEKSCVLLLGITGKWVPRDCDERHEVACQTLTWSFVYQEEAMGASPAVAAANSTPKSSLMLTSLLSLGAIIFLVIVILIFFLSRKYYPTAKNKYVLVTGFVFIDIGADAAFCLQLFLDPYIVIGNDVKYAALTFVLFPLMVNSILTFFLLRNEFRDKQVQEWFETNATFATITLMLSFTNLDVLLVLTSHIFNLSLFNAPFSKKTRLKLEYSGIVGNFIEDIPQFIIQCVVITRVSNFMPLTWIALATSLLAILFGIVRRTVFFGISRTRNWSTLSLSALNKPLMRAETITLPELPYLVRVNTV